MKSAAFLQLHLPEHWPDPGALDEPPLRWAWSAGGRVEEGVSSLAEIPRADEICLVLPVARVAFVRASLPPGCPAPGPSSGTGSGGFAALGGIEAIALDASLDGRPPLSLKLAADERRRRGDAPQAVRMLLAGSADAPDTGRWAESLHVPVAVVGTWVPEATDAAAAACPNLLPGAGGGRWSAKDLGARFRPAAILAAAILAVPGLLTVADWSRLAYEARSLRGEMEAAFRNAFRDAKAVVDPALQMRRNVADLRRAAGQPDATDFVPVLAKFARALAAAGPRPQSLRDERGELATSPSARRHARKTREPAAGARLAGMTMALAAVWRWAMKDSSGLDLVVAILGTLGALLLLVAAFAAAT